MSITGRARRRIVPALALALAAAGAAAPAQEAERLSLPGFLAAMGLLETEEMRLPVEGTDRVLVFDLPASEDVRPVRSEVETDDNVIGVFEFRSAEGRLVETMVLTPATIAQGPAEARRFAMANLLVLRSFEPILAQTPEARMLGFGPVPPDAGAPELLDAVQVVGTRPSEPGAANQAIVMRHVGLMAEDSDVAVVALVGIDSQSLPVQNDAQLGQTYTGRAIASMRLEPAGAEAAPEKE